MKTQKTTWIMAAIIGFTLGLGGCEQITLPTLVADPGLPVEMWQGDSTAYLVDNSGLRMYGEINAAPFLADIDGNGTIDLVVGDAFGYVEIMINGRTDGIEIVDSFMVGTADGPLYICADAAPSLYDWDRDGALEMVVGCGDGTIYWVEFSDLTSGAVANGDLVQADGGFIVIPGGYAVPSIKDLNDDGLPDLVVGSGDGSLYFFENVGVPGWPILTYVGATFEFGARAAVSAADVDGNGEVDFVVGDETGTVQACDGLWGPCRTVLQAGSMAKPAVADYNHDGLMDLVVGFADGSIMTITAVP